MSLEEFEELCKNHDWFYMMADDQRAYYKGVESMRKIEAGLNELRSAREIYERYLPKTKIGH